MLLLQVVEVSPLILLPLLCQDLDILVRFTLVSAEQEEVGFPRTLSIRDNDFRRDCRLHEHSPLATSRSLTYTGRLTVQAHRYRIHPQLRPRGDRFVVTLSSECSPVVSSEQPCLTSRMSSDKPDSPAEPQP